MVQLVHELVFDAAARDPRAMALRYAGAGTGYGTLARTVEGAAAGFGALGLQARERIALYLPKREEAVAALFAASACGCTAVVIDPACGPARAGALLSVTGARVVVTTGERLLSLEAWLAPAKALHAAVLCADPCPDIAGLHVARWPELLRAGGPLPRRRMNIGDAAALLYDCGSLASAAPAVLTHAGAVQMAGQMAAALRLGARDRVLAALPLHRPAGLSQLTAAFQRGACAVLLNPLHARDIAASAAHEGATALAMPAAGWLELARLDLRPCTALRGIASTDVPLPAATAAALAQALPRLRAGRAEPAASEVAQ